MPDLYHPTPPEKMLAGQPQDPPWQSSEQDQVRPSWQAFGAPPADKQETYAYPQSGQAGQAAQAAQGGQSAQSAQPAQGYGQGYAQQGGYTPPSYTVQEQAYGAQDRPYGDQAYQEQQQGQSAPHWQAVSGLKPAGAGAKRTSDAKGFLASLFDFSFTSFVTPKIIKVIYVLITIWTVIWALIFLRFGFKYGGAAGGFFTLLVVDPILVVLTLGAYRMVLELFMVVHRMHEDLKTIRERGDN